MASKIPKWFDAWLLKQKNKQSMRAAGTRFFWEIMCWAAYTKGKHDWIEKAYQEGFDSGVAYQKPTGKAVIEPKRT